MVTLRPGGHHKQSGVKLSVVDLSLIHIYVIQIINAEHTTYKK